MIRIHWQRVEFSVIFSVLLLLGLKSMPVGASVHLQTDCPQNLAWRQKAGASFVLVYTADDETLAQEIVNNFGSQVEEELLKYEALFAVELDTPITIRLYPSSKEYYCLNALAPLISGEDTHSHIGSREIALIADAISRNPNQWFSTSLNAMRHEFAILFAEKISDGKTPPGLLQGLGGYFENPLETFERRFPEAGSIQKAENSFQRLIEEDIPASNSKVLLQQTSIVAYLIDTFGWSQFAALLEAIGELPGYRQAFSEVYLLNVQEVQAGWQKYFGDYVTSRWQVNIIHAYDLNQYDILLAAGAYTDALSGLQAAAPIVRLFGEQAKTEQVDDLLHRANQGVLAGNLALEARQLILVGDYVGSIERAEQAISLYNQLNDSRRLSELDTYRSMSLEIITLRTELESLKGFDAPLDPQKMQRILQIGERLSELGDAEGVKDVQLTLILMSTGQRYFIEFTTVIGLLVCVYLIYRRFRGLHRKKPPEMDLI